MSPMPIFTKLTLTILVFVKDVYIEFYNNPKIGLIADTSSPTDKCGLHIRSSVFYFVKSPRIFFPYTKRTVSEMKLTPPQPSDLARSFPVPKGRTPTAGAGEIPI